MAMSTHRPLIEEIEGREQDDRASLRAAWKRIQYERGSRSVTDLHVREFCFYVFARDRDGRGVQIKLEDIAKELECSYSTARKIVRRASLEFGLVAVTEERYATGSQSANRYSIDWPVVRSINAGRIEPATRTAVPRRQPPAPTEQPPALSGQGAVPTEQHIKESPRHLPRPLPTHSLDPDAWAVVVSELVSRRMSESGARQAVTVAKRRELTPSDASDLVERWERLRAHRPDVTVGWLYRWLTGASEPPPEGGRDQPPRSSSLTSESTRREMIRSRIVKAGRRAGASEAEIAAKVREALAAMRPPTEPRSDAAMQARQRELASGFESLSR